MPTATATRPMTTEELLALPENDGFEVGSSRAN